MTHEELTGTVDRFLFTNTENGYAVFVLATGQHSSVVVRGHAPNVHPGEEIVVKGSWTVHPKFGKQFEAESCSIQVPTTIIGLKKYLGSGLIKGIGPVYAQKLVDAFGTQVLEIIDKQPEKLAYVEGIGQKRQEQIVAAWQDQKEISQVMVFLQERNVSTAYAVKIYKTYRNNSIALIKENPYRLAQDIWGVGFKTADQIAHNLGIAKDSPQRIKAGILFAIGNQVLNGHLYVELDDLKAKTTELLELDAAQIQPLLKHALHNLYDEEKIKLITQQEKHFVTLTHYYFCEKGIAQKVKNLIAHATTHTLDANQIYQQLRVQHGPHDIMLNEEQQKGVLACLQNKVTVITGGPGTGKTTLIKKMLGILDEHQLSYRLAAPTGRAAKRITEGTGRHALTLHRLLEYDFTTHGFVKNEKNALKLDFLIIDEASMIDVFLAHALLKALPYNAHLVLIGDIDQLPSVGAGNILNDFIASGIITCIRLKEIFRQAQDSLIIVNAHRVNNGEFPVSFLPDSKRDFFFIKEEQPENVIHHLESIFSTKIKSYHISPQDTMVLVPMNRGIVGTQTLNTNLQTMLNPSSEKKTLTHGATTFKQGDRVMQIRNNYDKHVYNGDIGIIEDINISDRSLQVTFDQRTIIYESGEYDELVLAYAISIHKSQGSEYPAVIIPLFMQHFTLLQRNLVYTALTRAKKLCIIIGQTKALAMAIKNNKSVERITFLKQFLTSDLACR